MTNLRLTLLTTAIAAGLLASAVSATPRGGMERERPSFAELDTDGSGGLSAEELRAPMLERFAAADTDGDGALSVEEITAQRHARRAERMVKRLDQNGDGLLQIEEMGRHGDRDPMSRIDSDGSGEVSAEEFAAAEDHMRGHRGHKGKRGHGGRHGGGDHQRSDAHGE